MNQIPFNVYLAGPISGLPNHNRDAFQDGELQLVNRGYKVYNPIRAHADEDPWHVCIAHDLGVLATCSRIAFLEGWEGSYGARIEKLFAEKLGIQRLDMTGVPGFAPSGLGTIKAGGGTAFVGSTNLHFASDPTDPFYLILKEMAEIHSLKAKDYGSDEDPYANIRATEEFGIPAWTGAMIRAADKLARVKAFVRNKILVNESLEDALLDGATYFAIALQLYRETKNG